MNCLIPSGEKRVGFRAGDKKVMKNIELKVKVDNFSSVDLLLKKIKAQYVDSLRQIDTYYHCWHGRIKIREINNRQFELIYYNRQNVAGHKISVFQRLSIGKKNLHQLKSIYSSAFGEMIIIEKTRQLWLYKHTRIHLDRVKGLGNFLESETVCEGINQRSAIAESRKIVEILQLNKYKRIKASYSDLMLK